MKRIMNQIIAALVIVILFGCATTVTEDEGRAAIQRYASACERAGFVPNTIDWERCGVYSAGYTAPQSPETLEQRLMRLYGERCQIAGFKVGTGAYGQCLLANADRDQAQAQAIAAAYLLGRPSAQPTQITMPTFNQATCTAIRAGIVTQVSCR